MTAESKSTKTYKLRYYASTNQDGLRVVSRHEQVFKTKKAMNDAAEKISIALESDPFFRWYSPLKSQLKGEHW